MTDVYASREILYAKLRNFAGPDELIWHLAFGAYIEIAKLTHKSSVITIVCDDSFNSQVGYALAHLLEVNFRVRVAKTGRAEPESKDCTNEGSENTSRKKHDFYEVSKPLPCDMIIACVSNVNLQNSIIESTQERARICIYLDGETSGIDPSKTRPDSKILCIGAPTLSLFNPQLEARELYVAQILLKNARIYSNIKLFYHAPKFSLDARGGLVCVLAGHEIPSGKSNFCATEALKNGALEVFVYGKSDQKLPQISYVSAPAHAHCYVCLKGAKRARKQKDSLHVLENPNISEINSSDIALFSWDGFLESGAISEGESWLDALTKLGQKAPSLLIGSRILVAYKESLFIFDKSMRLNSKNIAQLCGAIGALASDELENADRRIERILYAVANFKLKA